MDLKGTIDGHVDKAIDQAAKVAKQKVGSMIGGGDKKTQDAKKEGGVGDMISGAIGKAATEAAGNKAADQAMALGKNLFN